jgi:hypothetical protein
MTKKLYQAVILYTHPQTVIMNVEGETSEEATKFINDYLTNKLESFQILELEEVAVLPEEPEELEAPADTANVIPFPSSKTIH